jgi:hypothetical protein
LKPVLTPRRYQRTAERGDLNILEGKVIADRTGHPEEGVMVTAASKEGVHRSVTTDALGRYVFRLADGEWTIDVYVPSGRRYTVSRLIVNGGQIADDLGRDIPTLTITR